MQIADRGYDPKQDVYILSLTVTDPQTVGKITTQFFDTEKKSTVITSTQTIEQISATMQITQTATGLQPGREYCSQIRAETKDGTPLKNDKGDTVLASECGKYDPPQQVSVSFKIRAGVLNWQQHSFDITLGDISSPGGANLVYEGYINEGPRPVIAINHAFLPKEALVLKESLIRITVPETETQALQQSQAPKEYSLHLKLSKEGDTQGTEQDFKFTAVAPPPPTFVQRLLAALGNPPVLIGILAIILIGAAIVVYPKLRAKQTVLPRPALPQNAPTVLYTPPKLASRASGEVTVLSSKETIRVTPPAPKMRLRIKVARTLDPKEQREEDISDFPCVLGREVGKEAGKRYFVITGDNEISRVHAEITVLGNKFFITDRSSTNGTFIGDTRLEKEKQVSLTGKTAIRLGTFTSLEIEPRAG